jgi:hypothetical protein
MAGFVRPIGDRTLANMADGGAIGNIAQGLLKGQEIRQQRQAAEQERQLRQQQIDEYKANEDLRNKQRKLELAQTVGQLKSLPQKQANEISQLANQETTLKIDAIDNAMNLGGSTVRGAKSYRQWRDANKEALKEYFPSEEQYSEFMKQPYSQQNFQKMLEDWRTNKPAMIDYKLKSAIDQKVAETKTGAGQFKPQVIDVTKQAALYKKQYDLELETSDRVANIASDLHKSGVGRTQSDIIIQTALQRLENDPTAQEGQWFSKDYSNEQLTAAVDQVQAELKAQETGTGFSMQETAEGGERNPIILSEGDTSWQSLPDGTWVMINGKKMQVQY